MLNTNVAKINTLITGRTMREDEKQQITECLDLLQQILRSDLLGVYLYSSCLVGGLQKYSDIDLFVITNRATTSAEKGELATHLLKISGVYMKSTKPPIEMTIIEKSAINQWQYPLFLIFNTVIGSVKHLKWGTLSLGQIMKCLILQ